MFDAKKKNKEIEEKYNIFKKEIQNERMFLFKVNQLFNDEFDDMLEEIFLLNESQFMSQLKNRVETELEEIYSDKIFSEKKFTNILDKAFNSIKIDYKPNYQMIYAAYDNYLKNKNTKKNDIEFLTNKYRRHCIKETDNEFATHICNSNLGKFILVKKYGKIEFVICSNCKKVYYSNMILCKCYKCNKEYYTEILSKNDDEFLLPATWENYHCKQIVNEKIKCIKCHEILYINLKTGMLNCSNKKCNFNSKPTKILWTCAICQEDFKSGAIPYNPLEVEIIKKIVKQTLLQKQKAHPNFVPCCKINVFFTEFHHKKKCPGILYTGELNGDIIIVCEKCHAINYYDRFIWTCPKCGGKFSDEKKNGKKDDNSFNDDNNEDTTNINSYNTISIDERKKSLNKDNNNNNDNSYFGNIKKPFFSSRNKEKRKEVIKDSKTNKEYKSKRINVINNYNSTNNYNSYNSEKYSSTIEQPRSFKKIYCSKLNKKNPINSINSSNDNNILKDNEKEKDINNYNTEDKDNDEEKENTGRFKRLRFYTVNDYNNKKKKQNEKKLIEIPEKKEKKNLDEDDNEQKEKNDKITYNNFANYIHKRKMELKNNEKEDLNTKIKQEKKEKETKEKEERERERKDREESERKEKEEKEREEKEKQQNNLIRHSKRMVPYRSFKRNVEKKDFVEYNSSKGLHEAEKKESPSKENEIPKGTPKKIPFIQVRKRSEKKQFYKKPKLDLNEENENEDDDVKNNVGLNKNKIQENANSPKKEESIPSFKQRWKFKKPEAKNTLGKITKDTESSYNSKNNSSSKKKTSSISNEDKDKENSNTNSHKSNENDQEEEEDNNQNNNNNASFNPINKIPGMSEKLLNHTNRRISNIISKCSIPLINVEDYSLCQKIGEGSYGIIFSAMNKKDNIKQYALKKIISNKLKQIGEFTKEFELVHLCEHENIMKIYGYCIRILDPTTFALYILMELAERDWDKEIKKKLLQRKNYSEKELISILYQLTSALLYIQEKFHLSHRDIKPQNVLVFSGGKYKLADFGEAKEAKVSRQINTLRGTELYMSPALYNGLKNEKNDVTHNPYKSDVFSLGFCFLYASALNFNLLYEVRDILDSRSVNIILHKFLNKFYSEKLIQLLGSMLEIDEAKRFDFKNIKEYIENNYPEINNIDK